MKYRPTSGEQQEIFFKRPDNIELQNNLMAKSSILKYSCYKNVRTVLVYFQAFIVWHDIYQVTHINFRKCTSYTAFGDPNQRMRPKSDCDCFGVF